jgi:site-specific DNA-methyltransferase (adenine-specific)
MASRVEHLSPDVTLYLGDCREILPTLPKVDAVVTDPPYGIGDYGGKWGKKSQHRWDSAPANNEAQLLAAGNAHVIWGGNYFRLPPSRGWLAWFKPDRVPSAADFELAWTSLDMNSRHISQSIAATNAERAGHPTQKPVRVMLWSLSFVPNADCVIDPYMGSGTTGVACVQLGRKFIGIEIELKYFDIACRRISNELKRPSFPFPEPAKPKPVKQELFAELCNV